MTARRLATLCLVLTVLTGCPGEEPDVRPLAGPVAETAAQPVDRGPLVRFQGPAATMIRQALESRPEGWTKVTGRRLSASEIAHGGVVDSLPEIGICQEAELTPEIARAFPDSAHGDLFVQLVVIFEEHGLVNSFKVISPYFEPGKDPAKDELLAALAEMFDHWRSSPAVDEGEPVMVATLIQLTWPQASLATEGCYESVLESFGAP